MKKVSFFFAGLLLASPLQAGLLVDITGSSKSTVIEISFYGDASAFYKYDAPSGVVQTRSLWGAVPSVSDAINLPAGVDKVSLQLPLNSQGVFVDYFNLSQNVGYGAIADTFTLYDEWSGGDGGEDVFSLSIQSTYTLGDGDSFSWSGTVQIDLADYGLDWSCFNDGTYDLKQYGVSVPTRVTITTTPANGYGKGGKPRLSTDF